MTHWSRAAVPSNDEFTNRITLEGSSLTFTGSLVGATRQQYEVWHFNPGKTVWWSWTATELVPVTMMVERINVSPNLNQPDEEARDHLTFYCPTDLASFPSNFSGGSIPLPVRLADPLPNLTFFPTVGTTYQIQLEGESTNGFRIRLIATNSPIIVEQPRDLLASPGASALLTVIAVGVRPFNYQWRFNGADLPGESSAMLALTNLSAAEGGTYSVVVSNETGVVQSEAATLTVSDEEIRPELTSIRSPATNHFSFQLCGEAGRYYRIESSTNLQNWQAETSFRDPRPRYSTEIVTSVVFESNACSSLVIPKSSSQKYVRAVRYAPTNEICNLQLKQLRFAKELWTRDRHMWGVATPRNSELTPYFRDKQFPRCPSGGGYTVNWVKGFDRCTVPGHVLEEPR